MLCNALCYKQHHLPVLHSITGTWSNISTQATLHTLSSTKFYISTIHERSPKLIKNNTSPPAPPHTPSNPPTPQKKTTNKLPFSALHHNSTTMRNKSKIEKQVEISIFWSSTTARTKSLCPTVILSNPTYTKWDSHWMIVQSLTPHVLHVLQLSRHLRSRPWKRTYISCFGTMAL